MALRSADAQPNKGRKRHNGFRFHNQKTLKLLQNWSLRGGQCTSPLLTSALDEFLAATHALPGDRPRARPVPDRRRKQAADRLALIAAVAGVLGLKVVRARLRTPVPGTAGRHVLVKPLRNGADFEFFAIGGAGTSRLGVQWRQVLAFRAAGYADAVKKGRLQFGRSDFDRTFGITTKPPVANVDEHASYLHSAVENDLWWLGMILRRAQAELAEKFLQGHELSAPAIERVLHRNLGINGFVAVKERLWRSRAAFGLPLATVNPHADLEANTPARTVGVHAGQELRSWPMTGNGLTN